MKNATATSISSHDKIKRAIYNICNSLGYNAKEEYGNKGWRTDVYVESNGTRFAFEVQMSPQSLKKTVERQEKLLRDDVFGCWLFEKEPARQNVELEKLPVFKVINRDEQITVSLKGRKELPLDVFIRDFIENKIQFRNFLTPLPKINITVLEMGCWKCGLVNHIYFVSPFDTPCNTHINIEETLKMWSSDKFCFKPEIINKVKDYANSKKGKHLNLATIKERHSYTVGDSYLSFGCSECDSIFGDFYVMQAILFSNYGDGVVDRFSFDIDFDLNLKREFPHWCHPGENDFCK